MGAFGALGPDGIPRTSSTVPQNPATNTARAPNPALPSPPSTQAAPPLDPPAAATSNAKPATSSSTQTATRPPAAGRSTTASATPVSTTLTLDMGRIAQTFAAMDAKIRQLEALATAAATAAAGQAAQVQAPVGVIPTGLTHGGPPAGGAPLLVIPGFKSSPFHVGEYLMSRAPFLWAVITISGAGSPLVHYGVAGV
jgi:hypothetical protein